MKIRQISDYLMECTFQCGWKKLNDWKPESYFALKKPLVCADPLDVSDIVRVSLKIFQALKRNINSRCQCK